jgi:hypothetical protein
MSSNVRAYSTDAKARRRADRALLATYHEAKLADLLGHVRAGFAAYDSGQIDAFQLDDVIDQYKRSAQELWKFCTVSGADVEMAVRALELRKAENDEPDWWEMGTRKRR